MSFIATWHPTYAFFRSPYDWGSFRVDLQRFKRLINGKLGPPVGKLVTNPSAETVKELIADGFPIACDIETRPHTRSQPWTGKDPTRAKLRTIGFGNRNWGFSLDWSQREPGVVHEIRELLLLVPTIWHNGAWFDHRVLRRYGFKVRDGWEDTRDARRALSPSSRLSLAHCRSLYDDCGPWKEGEDDDVKGLVFTDKMEDLQRYNAEDCIATARVWDGICNEADWYTPRVERLYKLHKEMSVVAAECHTAGFRVDFRQRQLLANELLVEFKLRRDALLKYVNVPGFKCQPNHMRQLLYKSAETKDINRFHLPDPIGKDFWTPTGLIRVNQASLLMAIVEPGATDELKKTVDLYWQAAAAWKARSTYVVSTKVLHAIGRDKRVRAGWNSCGTDRGRWSCAEPNLTNLSAKDRNPLIRGALSDVRRMYRAERGYCLPHADWKQLELYVRAYVTGDKQLLEDLASVDVYSMNAVDWFGLDKDFPGHPRLVNSAAELKALCKANETNPTPAGARAVSARFTSKTGHLAYQYGAGLIKGYQTMLKDDRTVKFMTAKGVYTGFKKRYHRTVEWWYEEYEKVLRQGYSADLILDRRLYYPRRPDLSEAVNYPIAATAASLAALAIVRIRNRLKDMFGRKYLKREKLLTHEHDAFTLEMPLKYKEVGEVILKEEMERPVELCGQMISFKADVKCGRLFSEV